MFFDALQDMAALKKLEKLTNETECLKIIEEDGKYSITFSDYPHSNDWLLTTREKINSQIKANIEALYVVDAISKPFKVEFKVFDAPANLRPLIFG